MIKTKSISLVGRGSIAPFNGELSHKKKHGGSSITVKSEIPTPLEFDTFIPWVCKQWCGSTSVIVTPKSRDQLNVKSDARKARSKVKTIGLDAMSDQADSLSDELQGSELPMKQSDIVPITAYYDAKQQLVEISIVDNTIATSRKIIQAFSLSVPYHTTLTRFTFRRSGLTAELIYEIKKLLVISNICEICFDDSYVREGNYYILLEQFSQLKHLSLNRCRINDETCKKIFAKINFDSPAANTLRILELGSNDITDIGAGYIGSILRANRSLRHLNISNNKITDHGFIQILDSLMEFPLEDQEIIMMRRRKMRYVQSKMAVYARCLNDLKCGFMDDLTGGTYSAHAKRLLLKRSRMPKDTETDNTALSVIEEEAEIIAREIVGEFNDPFSAYDVEMKNGLTYSKGNFVLCSLNIAYNDLYYPAIRKLSEVMLYQCEIFKSGKDIGLMRVTLDGNNIPKNCPDLDTIGFCLKNVVDRKSTLNIRRKSFGHKYKKAM